MTNDEKAVRTVIENWARAVESGDRKGILANHADDLANVRFPGRSSRPRGLRQNLGLFLRQTERPDPLYAQGPGRHSGRSSGFCNMPCPLRRNLSRRARFPTHDRTEKRSGCLDDRSRASLSSDNRGTVYRSRIEIGAIDRSALEASCLLLATAHTRHMTSRVSNPNSTATPNDKGCIAA